MEHKVTFDPHPSEEMLEEYCFNRLPEATVAAVEVHLLECRTCQGTLQDLDEYILLMKTVTSQYSVASPSGFARSTSSIWSHLVIRLGWAWNTIWAAALGLIYGTADRSGN